MSAYLVILDSPRGPSVRPPRSNYTLFDLLVGSHDNSYWAFDSAAQGGAGRLASVPPAPYPGWKPGQASYDGRSFSTVQVRQWTDWYIGALVDGIHWQISAYEQLGFSGYKQVLMPGLGSRPAEVEEAIASRLNGAGDSNRTLGRGAAWHTVVDSITVRQKVVACVSSVADGSGRDDSCQPGDRSVSLGSGAVNAWSASRWISYNADRYGLPKMGENPGRGDAAGYGNA